MVASRSALLYALPSRVERARVLAGADGWREPLRRAGVLVVEDGACDLVVAPAAALPSAAATAAPFAILVGHASRRSLRRVGLVGERLLPVPSLDHPALLIPLDRARVARYGMMTLSAPPTRRKRLRNRAIALAARMRTPIPRTVTIASRDGGLPELVAAGVGLGVPREVDWLLAPGRATERGVFHLFAPREAAPRWVLKFSRRPLDEIAPPTDVAGLRLVAEHGGRASAHATRLLGVAEASGRPVVVESAAIGAPLVNVLRAPIDAARKRRLVEAVATWIVELGAASRRPDSARRQTPLDLGPAVQTAPAFGVDVGALASRLAGVPTVLEHGDVGLEHVIADSRDGFVVIDWERAKRNGMPLFDLVYFLTQALPTLDGEIDDPAFGHGEAFARLYRGESPSATALATWLARGCDACGVPREAVGPLLSAIWLRVAEVDVRRHFAEAWFSDPRLGVEWRLPART